jgi:hypothetical protein
MDQKHWRALEASIPGIYQVHEDLSTHDADTTSQPIAPCVRPANNDASAAVATRTWEEDAARTAMVEGEQSTAPATQRNVPCPTAIAPRRNARRSCRQSTICYDERYDKTPGKKVSGKTATTPAPTTKPTKTYSLSPKAPIFTPTAARNLALQNGNDVSNVQATKTYYLAHKNLIQFR